MTYEEAFDKVYAKMDKRLIPKGDNNYPRLLAFMWSMMAEALSDGGIKNVLDDFVYISHDQFIRSVPIEQGEESSKLETPKELVKKAKKDNTSNKGTDKSKSDESVVNEESTENN